MQRGAFVPMAQTSDAALQRGKWDLSLVLALTYMIGCDTPRPDAILLRCLHEDSSIRSRL